MKALDISGKKFGRLTALEVISTGSKRVWHCSCTCGGTIDVPTFQLRSGCTKSCGCLRRARGDLVGQKFGSLTVIERIGSDKNRRRSWLCRCKCGQEVKTFSKNLQRGSRVDCGCGEAERNRQRGFKRRLPEGVAARNALLSIYKTNAVKRGLSFTLLPERFLELCLGDCFYCGEPPSREFAKKGLRETLVVNGVDRMDNSKGYTVKNSVSCCARCNYLKREVSKDEFIAVVKKIASRF